MEKSYSESYAAAGVDITAGYRSVELMKQYVARTMNEHCIGGLGGFGGLFELDCTGYKHPVLISGTDGVGTKLRIAMLLDNPRRFSCHPTLHRKTELLSSSDGLPLRS